MEVNEKTRLIIETSGSNSTLSPKKKKKKKINIIHLKLQELKILNR